jgi:hypothetical protein
MLWLPYCRELRLSIGKRIALLSACWEQRISFLKTTHYLTQTRKAHAKPQKKQMIFMATVFFAAFAPLRERFFLLD